VDDETWLAIARSVDSGHVPTNEQYVRADLRASGYQIKAYARNTTLSHPHIITTRMFILYLSDRSVAGNPDACVVTYICECDPCGYLPKWAVNFDVDQPLVLAKYVHPTSFCALLARQRTLSEPAHEPTVHFLLFFLNQSGSSCFWRRASSPSTSEARARAPPSLHSRCTHILVPFLFVNGIAMIHSEEEKGAHGPDTHAAQGLAGEVAQSLGVEPKRERRGCGGSGSGRTAMD
jgi:hypothetical protein